MKQVDDECGTDRGPPTTRPRSMFIPTARRKRLMRLNEHQRRDLWFCGIAVAIAWVCGFLVGMAVS